MPLHLLGWVATALLAGHVCVRPEARQLATALLLAGLASLLAAWHVAYAGAACVVAAVAAAQRWVAPGSLALGAAFHVVAAWCLPVVTAWGVTMQFGDGLFSQEVGHLLPTTFEFAVLFLLPVVMVLAHPEEPLRLRQAESLAMLLAGFIDGCIESASIAHREACCKTREWAPSVDYQHILHAFTWGSFGLLGLVATLHGRTTDLHVGLGTILYGVGMLSHTHTMDDDKYTITWMHMHKASAALYIVGGYLRLTGKVLDGACVLFIGTLFFCLSAREVSHAIADLFPSGNVAVLGVVPLTVSALAAHYHVLHCLVRNWRADTPHKAARTAAVQAIAQEEDAMLGVQLES